MIRRMHLAAAACTTMVLASCSNPAANDRLTNPPPNGALASVLSCTADPAEIEALIMEVFANAPDESSALGKWNNIRHQLETLGNLPVAKEKVFDLVDFIILKRGQGAITADDALVADLVNQLFCYVGLEAGVTDPDQLWIVHVGDPIVTFVTPDGKSGIQFPANAVTENTLVTATRLDAAALVTELDEYPFVYDWSLAPSQTLLAGASATIGVCPDLSSLSDVPSTELQDVLDRLVLGHQVSSTEFEVLERKPIPAAMVLSCGDTEDIPSGSRLARVFQRISDLVLPRDLMAAAFGRVGGVGGSTSEFSAFGPVDPTLRVGGVGGSTSEFLRMGPGASLMVETPVAGTVGRQQTTGALPSVSVTTRRGTPIPGVGVAFGTDAPATRTPVGNASVCGGANATDAQGSAAVTCIDFGTTVDLPVAFTRLSANLTVPERLNMVDGAGAPIISFEPPVQRWLIESHGATVLAVTSPPAGRTVAAGNPYSADATIGVTVEVRSDLGEVVPIATPTIGLTLNKNSFGAGSVTSAAAVAGVASMNVKVQTAAQGYAINASATLAGNPATASSPVFDVVAGAAGAISIVGTADYGSVTPAGNPVSPAPRVRVTDAWGNLKAGESVFWVPGGASGAAVSATPTTTAADGTTSTGWTLGEGDNELVAALNAASGTPQVMFRGRLASGDVLLNSCPTGGAKDAIDAFYFGIPGPARNGSIRSVGLYISISGAPGQTDPTLGYPVTLNASRTWVDGSGTTRTENFSSTATALLRGDNGASNPENKLVTFAFNVPGIAELAPNRQPELKFTFGPVTGTTRKINFNAGPCGPGTKCKPPTGCEVSEYQLPVSAGAAIYRRSVAIQVRGTR
jgi:hypothetical protein